MTLVRQVIFLERTNFRFFSAEIWHLTVDTAGTPNKANPTEGTYCLICPKNTLITSNKVIFCMPYLKFYFVISWIVLFEVSTVVKTLFFRFPFLAEFLLPTLIVSFLASHDSSESLDPCRGTGKIRERKLVRLSKIRSVLNSYW